MNRDCEALVEMFATKFRACFTNEAELQIAVAEALMHAGIEYAREHPVDDGEAGRIDFLVDGGIGIECKVDGSVPMVARQMIRYRQSNDCHGGVILLTTCSRHAAVGVGTGIAVVVLRGGLL